MFLWQYVLVFKNPDFSQTKQTYSDYETGRLYNRCFWPDKRRKANIHQAVTEENSVFNYIIENIVDKETEGSKTRYSFNKGGEFEKDAQRDWNNISTQPKDILTLVRNIVMYKLNKVLHIQTVNILSDNGEFIYVLLHVDDETLKDEAERIEFPLQFEIGSTDLISLEPCDENFRPFRFIKKGKSKEIKDIEEELKKLFYYCL